MFKYFAVGGIALVGSGGAFVGVQAANYQQKIQPNVMVGDINVGGLTRDEAAKRIRVWWEGRRVEKIQLTSKSLAEKLPPMSATQLGVQVDDQASVKDLPLDNFGEALKDKVSGSQPEEPAHFKILFRTIPVDYSPLVKKVKDSNPTPKPAKAFLVNGAVVRTKEAVALKLDAAELPTLVRGALERGDHTVELPIVEAPKHVSDEALSQIKEVVSSFTTHFSAGNRPRATNIRIASSKLNGYVLLPGETASFNGVVGERTVKDGYQVAGVFKNGKHDVGLGGGICQVSGTLFNALMLGNLKIVRRQNHSLTVPYLQPGRDATVDYGNLDLAFKNDSDKPVAISSEWKPGTLTFRVLGTKDPSVQIKVATSNFKSWDRGSETVVDASLKPGSKKVLEYGASAHSVDTYRYVYRDGKLEKKELISHSNYAGAKRVVAVGPSVAPTPATALATPPAGTPAFHKAGVRKPRKPVLIPANAEASPIP